MGSIWKDLSQVPSFPPLEGDTETEVLVIGGGMAGILCAHQLHRAGIPCLLVEANTIGSGVTQNTTAKLTLQHGLIYDKLIKTHGLEKAGLYLQANRDALDAYRNLCQGMDCDYNLRSNFVYSITNRNALEAEAEALARLGQSARLHESLPLPFPVVGAVEIPDQAQFHPLKFLYHLARKLPIREHTRVEALLGTTAVTNRGKIRARSIIIATHFPFLNKHGSYFIKLYQHRSHVIALENAPDLGGMYVDEAENGMSFRNHGRLLLIGGGDHRTGKPGGGWQELRIRATRFYPQAREVAHWATQDTIPLDSMPYVGAYSRFTQGLYVATGFQKWGMTTAMVAATLLCDLVTGKPNPYEALFSPSRSMLHPRLFSNAAQAVLHLITPGSPRCPHMGCRLQWNPQEHTWDCPCHGSRFTREGKLINNPATGDLPRKGSSL